VLTAVAASGHLDYEALCFVSLFFPHADVPLRGVHKDFFFFHRGPNPLSAAPDYTRIGQLMPPFHRVTSATFPYYLFSNIRRIALVQVWIQVLCTLW
jgi:hypothetical protein